MAGDGIQDAIGHRFRDPDLLETALTHSSYAAENPGAESYERLEFLGDAVLGLITTTLIFEAMGDQPEGRMTKVRATVVDEATLASVAGEWGLAAGLRLGVGEERSGGRERASILSDVVEATVAAVFLDGGYEAASRVVSSTWSSIIRSRMSVGSVTDSRSTLQERLAKQGRSVAFEYERSGPDHASVFSATAIVDGDVIGTGSGSSKKAAAIAAAEDALTRAAEPA